MYIESMNQITKQKVYVTMTDSFMSGWGLADGKTNKLVIVCDSFEEAEIVKKNAQNRSEMKYVNIVYSKPRYNKRFCLTQFKTKEDMPRWFEEGAF
jgi:hypothetical protein